jgi:hypothetical protein
VTSRGERVEESQKGLTGARRGVLPNVGRDRHTGAPRAVECEMQECASEALAHAAPGAISERNRTWPLGNEHNNRLQDWRGRRDEEVS